MQNLITNEEYSRRLSKTIVFNGAAGNGAAGTVDLFAVTGLVKMRIMAICTENLVSDADPGGATIEIGIAGATTKFIAQTVAEAIDAGEIWHDATPDAAIELDSVSSFYLNNGNDVIATIATDDIISGAIEFICDYVPLSSDGNMAIA